VALAFPEQIKKSLKFNECGKYQSTPNMKKEKGVMPKYHK